MLPKIKIYIIKYIHDLGINRNIINLKDIPVINGANDQSGKYQKISKKIMIFEFQKRKSYSDVGTKFCTPTKSIFGDFFLEKSKISKSKTRKVVIFHFKVHFAFFIIF
jgi:hypothetical protein